MGELGEGTRGQGREQRVRERSEGPRGVPVASLEVPGRKQEVARGERPCDSELLLLAGGRRRGGVVGWALYGAGPQLGRLGGLHSEAM